MIPPLTFRIREPDIEIPKESRGDFVQFDKGGVAARAGIVAESELESRGGEGGLVSGLIEERQRGG